jgi:hypothetical protein
MRERDKIFCGLDAKQKQQEVGRGREKQLSIESDSSS